MLIYGTAMVAFLCFLMVPWVFEGKRCLGPPQAHLEHVQIIMDVFQTKTVSKHLSFVCLYLHQGCQQDNSLKLYVFHHF